MTTQTCDAENCVPDTGEPVWSSEGGHYCTGHLLLRIEKFREVIQFELTTHTEQCRCLGSEPPCATHRRLTALLTGNYEEVEKLQER